MTLLIRNLLLMLCFMLSFVPGSVQAQQNEPGFCQPLFADLTAAELFDAQKRADFSARTRDQNQRSLFATMQSGLATALQDPNPLLRDDTWGDYTRNGLARLCQEIPDLTAENGATETIKLAVEFGELTSYVPFWRGRLTAVDDFLPMGPDTTPNLTLLRLAGSPSSTAAVLRPSSGDGCAGLTGAALSQRAQVAFDTLAPGGTLETLCAVLPVFPGGAGFADALDAYGKLEAAFPGALDKLRDPAFARWMAKDLQNRLFLLAGTRHTVTFLLRAFAKTIPDAPLTDPAGDPPSCQVASNPTTLTFYNFDQPQLDLLVQTIDVAGLLAPLAEQSFSSAELLNAAIRGALAEALDLCTVDRISQLVLGSDPLGLRFQLDPQRVAGFVLNPDLLDSAPVLQPLTGVKTANRDDLIAGLEINLSNALSAALNAQIEEAADLLSAAAEEVSEPLDAARVDPENFDPLDLPPLIGVTDASVTAALQTLPNEAFKQAIYDGPFLTGTNVELIKADVRALLRPLVADQVKDIVARDMALIDAAISSDWQLTPDLLDRIMSVEGVAQSAGDPSAANLEERMQSLLRITYPTERLFQAALNTIPAATGQLVSAPLSPDLNARAIKVATTSLENPNDPRVTGNFAAPDCNCVPKRNLPDNSHVYGFYPFWFSPLEEAARENPEAVLAPAPIDFGMISRIAFYGLEFQFEFPQAAAGDRNLQLKNLTHWVKMKRDFINSAHQHRAEVDLAFDLRNWAAWSEVEQTYAIERIVDHSGPIARLQDRSLAGVRNAIPTLFDVMQPDGVTLIFEDYSGRPNDEINTSKMIRIIRQVQDALEPRGQTVNLAFDFSLIDVPPSEALMNDLRELLIPGEDGEKTVDKILVFLERPTTETKKNLRARMDQGDFRGTERSTVLRSFIPILPPSAHEQVKQRLLDGQDPDPDADAFSQFLDDVVYFQDNFAGIGFWPVPLPDGVETPALNEIIATEWNAATLPVQLTLIQGSFDQVCTWSCPRRAYITLVAMAVFAVVILLTWRSFYSGLIDKIAFKMGVVRIGVAGVFVMLVILSTCDHKAFWPPILLIALIVFLLLTLLGTIIQRARNGPKP
ncbi:hypothetical protein ROLI_001670 [Roseobacter fucihabitans]|uniref:Uncharacterized protein n=1 Tax=Roseobacter fucihabitans TaxID=1537242 RepID=A0ABZ2BLW0_9RHOB|nr:hypothetical protein [Roseobacter litoralis]MBC6963417.1 hypothetical protein [Roseobacter litoralis]